MRNFNLLRDQIHNQENVLKGLVITLIGALNVLGIYGSIGLFADGALWLLAILRSNTFNDWDKARLFANWITQSPIVLALRLGVHDINTLIRIHSLGLVSIPSFFWGWALCIHWKTERFWYFLFAFSIVYLNTGCNVIGEYNVCYSMVALSAAVLFKNSSLEIFDCLLLLFLAVSLTRSYESMVFLGPLLYCAALGRCFLLKSIDFADSLYVRLTLIISSFFYAAATAIGAWFIAYPQLPNQLSDASDFRPIISSPCGIYSLFMIFVFLIFSVVRKTYIRRFALILGAAASIIFLSKPSYGHPFWAYFSFRATVAVGLFGILLIMLIQFFCFERNRKKENTTNSVCLISFLFFLSLIVPFLFHIQGLTQWFKQFEKEVNSQTGIIAWEASKLSSLDPNKSYLSDFSNGSLGVLLRQNSAKAIILPPSNYQGWQPFDPKRDIPKLPIQLTKKGYLFPE